VLSIFRRLVDDTGSAIVMVTHDLSLAAKADRQIQMSDGLIVGDPADIDRDRSSPAVMPI
jgi:ABC-type lipoprotein export system ATPase subunit